MHLQDETGVCKNLLQETAQRAGVSLPVYTTTRSGPGHLPVFSCQVELAGMNFAGEAAKTKKQAEKNAAMAAWSALKQCTVILLLLPYVMCLCICRLPAPVGPCECACLLESFAVRRLL
jgi:hypothetical protein